MSWFFFSLAAAVLFTSSIVTDKFLLVGRFKKVSELTLTTAAALAGIPALVIFILVARQFPQPKTLLIGIVAGWLTLAAYQLYYIALRKSDPALIATLFQLVTVFNLVAGLLFFRERPSSLQYVGLGLITVASILISFEEKEKKWVLRQDTLLLMIAASALLTLSDIVFKDAAEQLPFIQLSVAEYTSTVLAGLLLFSLHPRTRKELASLRKGISKSIGIMELNEVFTLLGTLSVRYSLVIGPLALIQAVMGTQPFIAIVLSFLLGIFGIHLEKRKKTSAKQLIVRLVLIITAVIGAVCISGSAI